MLRTKGNAAYLTVVIIAQFFLCGCGGGNSTPTPANNNMSPAQAQAVSLQVVQALTQSLENTFTSNSTAEGIPRPNLASAISRIHADSEGGCASTSTGENCDWPISLLNFPCSGTGGGTISVTGDVDGSLSNSGGGSISTQFTITPDNCSVSNLVVNGDPSVSVSGQISFSNTAPIFPLSFSETGGISYGPNPSGSCELNVTYTIASLSSCTASGTVCGQSVNGTC
jgi:hypothetical protein